jgi:hypothetical protein
MSTPRTRVTLGAAGTRLASGADLDVHPRDSRAHRSRTQADAARRVQADDPGTSGREHARKRRTGLGDERPHRLRCDQGVGPRGARGRRGDDRRAGRHEGRTRAADRLDHPFQAGQDRRGPEGRARLPAHPRVLDTLSGRREHRAVSGELADQGSLSRNALRRSSGSSRGSAKATTATAAPATKRERGSGPRKA